MGIADITFVLCGTAVVVLVMILFKLLDIAGDLKRLGENAADINSKLYKLTMLNEKLQGVEDGLSSIEEQLRWYKKHTFAAEVLDKLRRLDK